MMFVVTRRKNEGVQISDNVFIKVISSKDGSVRLGIDAPRTISIIPQKNIKPLITKPKVKEAKMIL